MNKTEQADIKLPFVARFRNIVTAMFLIRRMANVAGGGGGKGGGGGVFWGGVLQPRGGPLVRGPG